MKIVILTDSFEGGGSDMIARLSAYGLKRAGHNVSVIISVQKKSLAGKKNVNGIDIYSVFTDYNLFWRPYVSLYNRQTFGPIKEILNNLKPDIVHAHVIHIYLSYAILKIAKKLGAKVFLTAHDAMLFHYGKLLEFSGKNNKDCADKFNYKVTILQQIKMAGKTYNPFRNLVIRHYLKYVDKIFAVSDALRQAHVDNGIENIATLHNGIDIDEWKISNDAVKNFKFHYGLKNKKVILFGGRIGREKGMMMMMAMREIIKIAPQAILLVVAKVDDATENMIKTARDWRIENNIIITGWLTGSELKAAYFASDVVTVPSVYFDSFPTINLEAMACHKPVIATCFGGSREAVLDGQTGYIVNPYNIDNLASKIIDLLQNPEKAKTFGEAGYERVKSEFNVDRMLSDYLIFYE